MHDALEDICDRMLRTDNPVPYSGGTPATLIITIDLDDLLANTGYGVASDGTLIRTATVREVVDQAEVYTAFLTAQGEVLRLGRTRRIATRGQTVALIARDRGCSFPGCDTAPEWCERHVRREALFDRSEVRDLRRRLVAAGRLELRAA
jgi:hypothetical protein